MEWVYLEGIQRVNVSYKVWRQTRRALRHAKKDPATSKRSIKYLKEDVQYELDELIDAILCLRSKELDELLQNLKSERLYQLIQTYKD